MKISIITVVLNAKKTIRKTIESVLLQEYKDIEYLIIDGGSTDGTLSIIEEYRSKLSCFVSEPDCGIYDAMNKGIKKSTGDIIGLLNADDWYEKEALPLVAAEFERTKASIVAGGIFYIEKNGIKKLRRQVSFSELWRTMPTGHPSIFITRKAYNEFGLYDTQYKIAADYELLLRMYHAGSSVTMTGTIFANFRIGGTTSTHIVEGTVEYNEIIQKYCNYYPDKIGEINCLCETRLKQAKAISYIERHPSAIVSVLNSLKSIKHNSHLVVWGTGVWANRVVEALGKSNISVDFFVDSDAKRQGQKFYKADIKEPSVLEKYDGIVFIAVKDYDVDIAEKIKNFGNHNLHFILLRNFIDVMVALYDIQEANKNVQRKS